MQQGMKRLLLGELDQMSHRFDRRMSIPAYLKCQRQNSRTFSLSCLEGPISVIVQKKSNV